MADTVKYVAAGTKTLSASITSTATTVALTDINSRDGTALTMTDFGTIGYATIEPDGSNMEIVSFTGISSTSLTGVTRGLGFEAPYTTVTALKKAHSAGVEVVFSNVPQLYDEFLGKDNDETITGVITFTSTAIPIYDTDPTFTDDKHIIDKKYADDLAIAGSPDASTTVKGIVEEATDAELAAGTAAGAVARLFANGGSFTQTATASKVPVADATGKIGEDWLGLTTAGDLVKSDGTDLQRIALGAADTFLKVNAGGTDLEYGNALLAALPARKFGGDGSDGALDTSGGVVDIDLSSANFLEKSYSAITITSNNLTFSNPATDGSTVHIRCSGDATISANIVADIGGAAGAGGAGGVTSGQDGTVGGNGTDTSEALDATVHYGTGGTKGATNTGGSAIASVAAYDISSPYTIDSSDMYRYMLQISPGNGGAGGGGGAAGVGGTPGLGGAGGAGGAGGGAIILEVAGDINFTGTIDASGGDGTIGVDGAAGGSPSGGGGAGGGGAGGSGGHIVVLYATQTAISGTLTVTGGDGKNGGNEGDKTGSPGASDGGGGGAGGSGGAFIQGTGGGSGSGGDGNGSNYSAVPGVGGSGGAEGANGSDGARPSSTTQTGDGGCGGGGGGGAGGEAFIAQNEWFY